MNRRGFFKGLLAAACVAAARIYSTPAPAPRLTLLEYAQLHDDEGISAIAAILGARNPILDDLVWTDGEKEIRQMQLRLADSLIYGTPLS